MSARTRTYALLLLLVLLLVACSCAGRPGGRQACGPVRVVTCTVLYPRAEDWPRVSRVMREASERLEREVCVALHPTVRRVWEPPARGRREALRAVWHEVPHPQTDMVLAFVRPRPAASLIGLLTGCELLAVIDDTWRRYVVMWHWHDAVLVHEIGHAFIRSHLHSERGVMMPAQAIRLLPFFPLLTPRLSFAEPDRVEVLRNRWRSFDEPFVERGGGDDLRQ